mgnify:CR=1 FL=1
MNKYEKIVLSNKAPILTVPLLEAQTITALIIFKTGSRYETKETNGLSHFLEHMFFKGTVSRPSTLAIASDLDALGCEFNAFTGKEYTGYWIKSAKSKLCSALEVFGDMLLNSKYDDAEIDRDQGIIIEELKHLDLYNIVFNVVIGILILIIYIFSRTTLELHKLFHYKGNKHSAIENIRLQRQSVKHTWLMLLVPLPICLIGYFAWIYFKPLPQLIPYWVFLVQAAAAILGTLINHFILHSFERQMVMEENPIEVIYQKNNGTEDNNDTPLT